MAKDGTVWMNQNQLAELFATTKQNISLHIKNILKEGELDELSVVKEYLTTASDGKKYKATTEVLIKFQDSLNKVNELFNQIKSELK
ncbi:MAG: hypothetical protein J7J43_05300 [Thermosipho sp. (in: Bacteria)]|nr:hypothetical protein [Thermosipho sp. (in: thermotogales)]